MHLVKKETLALTQKRFCFFCRQWAIATTTMVRSITQAATATIGVVRRAIPTARTTCTSTAAAQTGAAAAVSTVYRFVQWQNNETIYEFSEWKASVPLTNRSTSKGECPIVKEETRTFGIETRLRNFDLSNATPMMCMNFIAELKHNFINN